MTTTNSSGVMLPAGDLVDDDELLGRDAAGQQRLQAVLHADVVARLVGADAIGSLAEDRRRPVPGIAARATGIGDRVVDQGGRHLAVVDQGAGRDQRAIGREHQLLHVVAGLGVAAEGVVPAMARGLVGVAVDGGLLGRLDGGRDAIGAHQIEPGRLAVGLDQLHAVADLDGGGLRIRIGARDGHAVEQAGRDGSAHVRVDRSARAAGAHRELDRPVAVDDALLHTADGLGHQHPVGVDGRIGHAVGRHQVAARELGVERRPGALRTDLAPGLARAGAELV
ncbi:MAG: hypothetical protein EOP73_32000, partial [Variovorax sp.]